MVVTAERLREVLAYCPDTGIFTWLVTLSCRAVAGKRAGSTKGTRGVVTICIDGQMLKAHRLAWLYVHGVEPDRTIDHINGNPSDNRIANLRLCTMSQNLANAKRRADNSSGFKGVTFNDGGKSRKKCWAAEVRVNGVRHRLGRFYTKEEAHAAYIEAARRHFGEFARAA